MLDSFETDNEVSTTNEIPSPMKYAVCSIYANTYHESNRKFKRSNDKISQEDEHIKRVNTLLFRLLL